jgi:hypothetical protein
MRTSTLVLFAASAITMAAHARVLPHAPYTNRIATLVAQERNTRHFALLEASDPSNAHLRQLVVYDTEGDEPRVVFPESGDQVLVSAALFQSHGDADGRRDGAVSLLVTAFQGQRRHTFFSGDGGDTWKEVAALSGQSFFEFLYGPDTGGPYVRGMGDTIRTGHEAVPFVVSSETAVWAIDATGTARQISTRGGTLIGQNLLGTQFLVSHRLAQNPDRFTLELLHVSGGSSRSLGALPPGDYYGTVGWITSNETAYIVASRVDGRFLYQATPSGLQFIRGPYDASESPTDTSRELNHFIAVPTNDFNGAWMVQQEPGRASTLARHTITVGLEEMGNDGNDDPGRQIEALIAGESGQTLLIQAHRDLGTPTSRFLEPLVAVWHVGAPLPSEYDELYLAQEYDKGFVHVDVDRMEAGEPFVFSAGSTEVGFDDVLQDWGVVRASMKQRLVLPGVARLPGAYGSFWLTDVTLFNPLAEAQRVEITYVPAGPETSLISRRFVTVTLAGREVLGTSDALASWFFLTLGGGAIHIEPERAIHAFARTYNRAGEGTYGFGMMAIDSIESASARHPVTFSGAFPGSQFRTNVLVTDTSGRGTEATLGAYGAFGAIGLPTSVFAPAGGIMQFNSINAPMNLLAGESGGLVVQPTRGTAIATVVAIDNRTNDPTYFPPDVQTKREIVSVIPVIGHLDGANGSRFRSDLYLHNPNATTRTVVLEATRWNARETVVRQFTLLPNESRTISDAAFTVFQMQGLARLRYWSNDPGEGVIVTSRTYTIDDNGATYGTLVPPLDNQVADRDEHLEIIGVTGGGNYRTNLALVELSPPDSIEPPVGVRIHVGSGDGQFLGSFSLEVPRAGGLQINDLFGSRGIPVPDAALIVIQVFDGGLVTAYATLTDNVTNDTTYLGAIRGMPVD